MPVLALFSGLFLFVTLILANSLQVLSLVLLPFSKPAFRRANREIANCWWGLCVLWTEHVHRIRPVITGDKLPEGENAVVISNHQQMPDVIALLMLGWHNRRVGDLKWFAKDVIKYVPGVGWGMQFLDCVFLKRDWDKDEARVRATFGKFVANRISLWLVSFPEGTRITPLKLERAQAFALKSGLRVPSRVLIPRTRGFSSSVLGLTGQVTAVYDVTIGYPGRVPTLWRFMNQFGGAIHIHVKRYPLSVLPKDAPGLAGWILDRYAEKDLLLERFAREHAF